MLKIGDVSSYQGNYTVGTNGEDGIIAKITEGTDYLNPFHSGVLQQAIQKGLPFGGYHFASASVTAEQQAEYHFANAKEYFSNPNYVDILDYEIGGNATDFITKYVAHLKEISGAKTIWVYGGQGVIAGAKASGSPLWLAGYPYASSAVSPATWDAPTFPYDTKGYLLTMWQFTTSGGKFDRSIFYGDVKAWESLSVKATGGVAPEAPVKVLSANDQFRAVYGKYTFKKAFRVDAMKQVNGDWQVINFDLAGVSNPTNQDFIENGIPVEIVDLVSGADKKGNVQIGSVVKMQLAYDHGTIDQYHDSNPNYVGIVHGKYGLIWFKSEALINY